MERKTLGLVDETRALFRKIFGFNETNTIVCPGSLILLGDHTHYNDGIILSTAIDRYVVTSIKARVDKKINIHGESCRAGTILDPQKFDDKLVCGNVNFSTLIEILIKNEYLKTGFDCLIKSNIPICIGIGRITAHFVSLLLALNKTFNLNLSAEEIIQICRESELNYIGKISNKAHAYTILLGEKTKLFKLDLRNEKYESVDWMNGDYKLMIINTNNLIPNAREICNERIDECKVGVEGLRLYIWGIKNLRDVQYSFLEKHVNMIPKLVYKRVKYNVQERMRVESVLNSLKRKKGVNLGEVLTESHEALRNDFDIGIESLDFIVEQLKTFEGVVGSKMISCSTYHSVFAAVQKNRAERLSNYINSVYKKKFKKNLEIIPVDYSNGIKTSDNSLFRTD